MADRDPKGKPNPLPGSPPPRPNPAASATPLQKPEKSPISPEQKQRSAKRKRRLVYLSIIFLLLLVNGYLFTSNVIITQEKDEAEQRAVEAEKLRDKAIADYQQALANVDQYKMEIAGKDSLLTNTEDRLQKALSRVEELLSRPGISRKDLAEARALVASMTSEKDRYFRQVDSLTQITAILMSENKIIGDLLDTEKDKNTKLLSEYEVLAQKVAKGSLLFARNIKFEAVRTKPNGNEVPTNKSKKASKLRIQFSVDGNKLTEKGEQKFYMHIEGPNGLLFNIEYGSGKFKDRKLGKESEYTVAFVMDFQNEPKRPTTFWQQEDPFASGIYKLQIYHLGYLVSGKDHVLLLK